MHTRRPLSNLRCARLIAWAQAWLVRLAMCCAQWPGFERPIHAALDKLAKFIVALIIFRVAPQRPRSSHRRPAAALNQENAPPAAFRRAFMGAHLRRSLRARSIGQRITALLNTLRDLEAHAARLSRRLARGLTRRRPIRAARDAEPFAAMPVLNAVRGADTS